ncbi:MAG: hypothetical protein QNJ61_16350 [Desulfobacterales bacterium]|nr:hypothetical protein [Desulfobacterales bacterium]
MNEFILVVFDETREVIIDDNPSGNDTGVVIELEAGTHTISLAGDQNFSPLEQDVNPTGTTPITPHEVKFTKV